MIKNSTKSQIKVSPLVFCLKFSTDPVNGIIFSASATTPIFYYSLLKFY